MNVSVPFTAWPWTETAEAGWWAEDWVGQSGEAEGAGRRRIRLEEDTEAEWRTGVVTWPGGKLEVDSGQSNVDK